MNECLGYAVLLSVVILFDNGVIAWRTLCFISALDQGGFWSCSYSEKDTIYRYR